MRKGEAKGYRGDEERGKEREKEVRKGKGWREGRKER